MARLIRAEISNSNTAEEGVAMLLYIEYWSWDMGWEKL